MTQTEVLLRGPEKLAQEKQLVEETVEDIGEVVGKDITATQVKASDFGSEELLDIYEQIEDSRDFESEFERENGGLDGGGMTSVLRIQPYTQQLEETHVMYVTDRPLFAQDRETGEVTHVYGITQSGHQRGAAVLSSFAFQEIEPEYQNLIVKTLAYHKEGHLLNEESDRQYRDEERFGGGHCPNPDVMRGEGILEDTYNRLENELYCEACTEELREGLES
jgi:hypothetical protein